MFLLDTCAVSDFVKGDVSTGKLLKSYAPSQIYISSVTCMEVEYGLQRIPAKRKKIDPIINMLFDVATIVEFSQKTALIAAKIRYELQRKGTPIGPYDFMIAASAIEKGLAVVTSNVSEFRRIKGLVVENWREEKAT